MRIDPERRALHIVGMLALAVMMFSPTSLLAQGRGRSAPGRDGGGDRPTVSVSTEVTISTGDRDAIRAYYAAHPQTDVEALPPGIRRNLERGKPLPPGIAKKATPPELRSTLHLSQGYDVVQVGLDVLLVDVATNVIHDVLSDIIIK